MKIFSRTWRTAALLAAALLFLLAPRASAQGAGSIAGTILDISAKPWVGLSIECVSEQGVKSVTTTDNYGSFSIRNLRTGNFTCTITKFPPPNDKQQPVQMGQVHVGSDQETRLDMNFKDIMSKQGAAQQEQAKKQAEEKQRFEGMKAHFTAGQALLNQEKQARDDLTKATPDQRDALKQKLTDLSNQAATEFQEAQKAAGDKDPNLPLLWGNLGQVYDLAGRNEEAEKAYQQAILLKPEESGYYNNLGNVLAKEGKLDEARAAYTKSAELDPTHAAVAWRNFGITLYNANRGGDAIEPLQKSAELDPKNAQTWYLLGACLIYKMTIKKVGDKDVPEFAPGTIEAYQKAIELDPDGIYGQQAKQGLEQLQQMAPGIDIKVNVKKKKS